LEEREETKVSWITCPECGAKIGIVLSAGRVAPQAERLNLPPDQVVAWPPTTLTERLSSAGIDLSLLDIEEKEDMTIVSPKKFLGDLWGPINDAMKSVGGNWIREGRQSRWEIPKQETL